MLLVHDKHESEIVIKNVQIKLNYFFILFLQALLMS